MVAKLLALVLPLGLDTFAVAAALGLLGLEVRDRVRVSAVFVAFEAGMPLVGLAIGAPLGSALGAAAEYVAIAVLIAFGAYTAWRDDEEEVEELRELSALRGSRTLLLGLSISLDELAIGFTLGLLRLPIVLVVVLIGVQALIVTQAGLRIGARLSERLREGAERLAGVALATLGIVLLVERLLAG